MPTSTDVRKYRETYIEELRKLVRAWIGATDVAYQRVRSELKELDTRNRARVEEMQERAKKLTPSEFGKQARETYTELAERGEKVIHDLRTRPRTRLMFGKVEEGLKHAEKQVEHAEEHVTGRPARTGKPTAHKASASK